VGGTYIYFLNPEVGNRYKTVRQFLFGLSKHTPKKRKKVLKRAWETYGFWRSDSAGGLARSKLQLQSDPLADSAPGNRLGTMSMPSVAGQPLSVKEWRLSYVDIVRKSILPGEEMATLIIPLINVILEDSLVDGLPLNLSIDRIKTYQTEFEVTAGLRYILQPHGERPAAYLRQWNFRLWRDDYVLMTFTKSPGRDVIGIDPLQPMRRVVCAIFSPSYIPLRNTTSGVNGSADIVVWSSSTIPCIKTPSLFAA